ncbi:MAG: glycogen/starch/alpha-glucan phosphorylase [Candidatus Caldarchaeum sp.]
MVVVSLTPEIALDEHPVYAGGLGVLEGDKFYYLAGKNRPYLVLTPFYAKGYVWYSVEGDELVPQPHQVGFQGLVAEDELRLEFNRWGEVSVRPYAYVRGAAKVVFLHVQRPEQAARVVERLYVHETDEQRDLAVVVFGKAASQYIRERVGLQNVELLDLQESWGALAAYLLPELRSRTRFIVHTIAPWTNLTVNADLVRSEVPLETGGSHLSMWTLACENAYMVYAVSAKHESLVKKYSEKYAYKTFHVTNGVNLGRWVHPTVARRLLGGRSLSLEEVRALREPVRALLRRLLLEAKPGLRVDEETMVVSWPRRITRYKRPYFVERLVEEVGGTLRVVFLLAGKAHPRDGDGQYMMRRFMQLHRTHDNVVYMHDYDLEKAKLVLAGSDLLLFTPFPGWEACGTSYMKAGVNGVPTLSSRDGGALEVIRDGVNGWLFGAELSHLVNIYDDHEQVAKIDEADYADLREKFKAAVKLFAEKPDDYLLVQQKAIETMSRDCSIEKALDQYYGGFFR